MTPSFSYSKGRKYYYYRCTKVTHLDRTACKIRIAPARETEKLIIDRLRVLSENRALIDKIIQKAKIQTSEALPLLRKELNGKTGELRRIEGEASNLLNIISGNIRDSKKNEFVVKRLDELEERGNATKARIQESRLNIEKLEKQSIDAEVIRQNFRSFNKVFEELKPAEKRDLMQLLIKEIQYDADHSKIRMALRPLPDIGPFIVNNQDKSCNPACSRLPERTLDYNLNLYQLSFIKDDAAKIPYILIDDFGFSIIRVRKGQKRVIPGEDWQTLPGAKMTFPCQFL
jgi:hypothetical protein